MSQFRLILLLLCPSWLSFGVVTAITLVVVGVLNWSYFTYNSALYDFFYGSQGVITTLERAPSAVSDIQEFAVNNEIVFGIAIAVAAIAAAAIMFFALRAAEKGVGAVSNLG